MGEKVNDGDSDRETPIIGTKGRKVIRNLFWQIDGLLIIICLLSACSFDSIETVINTPSTSAGTLLTPILKPMGTSTLKSLPTITAIGINATDVFTETDYAVWTEVATAPTSTPTPPISVDSRLCSSVDLISSLQVDGAYGHIVLGISITNHSNTSCFLPAWPLIQLLDREGNTIEINYNFIIPTEKVTLGEPMRFGLRAGQTSGMALFWGNWCKPAIKSGVIVRLTILGEVGWFDIPTDVKGGGRCDDPSSTSTIDVYGFTH